MMRLTIGILTLALTLTAAASSATAQSSGSSSASSDDFEKRMKEHRRRIRAAEKSGDRKALRKARRAAMKDIRANKKANRGRPQSESAGKERPHRKREQRRERAAEKPTNESRLAGRGRSLPPGSRAKLARARKWRELSQDLGEGATPEKIPPEARKELNTHARRMAKLRRASVVAGEEGNDTAARRARGLMVKEARRHDKRLKVLMEASR